MGAVTLAPNPIQPFFTNAGAFAPGALIFTYAAGTTTKLAAYTDSTGGTALPNPVILNARGEISASSTGTSCGLWLVTGQSYKIVYAPAGDTDPPSNPIWTLDNFPSTSEGTYNVRAFGAFGDNAHDDTNAIIAAIAACQAGRGGVVYFPPGTYLVTGTLAITASGVSLEGAGYVASTINFNNGSKDCITFIGTSLAQINGGGVRHISLDHTSKTGGRTLYCEYVGNTVIDDLVVQSAWTMFEFYIYNSIRVTNVWAGTVGLGGSSAYGLYLHAPGDGSARSDYAFIQNVVIDMAFSGANICIIDGLTATTIIDSCNWQRGNYGVWVRNTAGTSNVPNFIHLINLSYEGALTCALQFDSGNSIKIMMSDINTNSGTAGQGSADTGVLILNQDPNDTSQTNGITVLGSAIYGSKGTAVFINGKWARFIGTRIPSWINTVANSVAAIIVGGTATQVQFIGNSTNQGSNWQYGLQVNSGATYITGFGNDFNSAQTAAILNNSGDSNTYFNDYLGSSSPAPVFIAPNTGQPTSPQTGQIIINSGTFQGWNGSAWVNL